MRPRLPSAPDKPGDEANAAYCAAIIRRHDPDRWLALSYAPQQVRARLTALYALQVEIRQVPGAVSEPPLGEIRLQWWRDALDAVIDANIASDQSKPQQAHQAHQALAHPVIAHVRESGAIDAVTRATFEAAIDARARLLYGAPFTSVEDVFEWADIAEGFIAALTGASTTQEADHPLIRAESAFVLATERQTLAAALAQEIGVESKKIHAEIRPHLKALNADEAARHLHLALTPLRLSATGPFTPVRARLRLFTAMATGRF